MHIYEYKTAILIVLYNCELNDSNTFNSLSDLLLLSANSHKLVIWNNGPSLLDDDLVQYYKKKFDFELVQTVENISLAKIYNDFINLIYSEKYVILDHDSVINSLYLNSIFSFNGYVGVPEIFSKGSLHSPRRNKKLFSQNEEITAIGSGLVISRKVIDLLYIKYNKLFDERFVLYGVDTTFFYRLNSVINLNSHLAILPTIKHSLSSDEDESKVIDEFRLKEKSYDFGLRLRFYTSIDKVFLFFLLIFKSISKRSPLKLSYICDAIIKGSHYRK